MKLQIHFSLLLFFICESLCFTNVSLPRFHYCGTIICPALPEIDGGVRRRLDHVRSTSGEIHRNVQECTALSSPKVTARALGAQSRGFRFRRPSLGHFSWTSKRSDNFKRLGIYSRVAMQEEVP